MSKATASDVDEVFVVASACKMHLPPDHPENSRERCRVPFNYDGRRASPQALLPIYEWCSSCFPERAEREDEA